MKKDAPTTGYDSATAVAAGNKRRNWLKFPRSWKEVRALGWKMILVFILFYLIRDSILYILLPYLAYKGFFG